MTRIGLVLGGGGAVGMAYHAGVLMGLEQATGWDARSADVIVGTSAGALSGAELRAGFSPSDLAARRTGAQLSPGLVARLRRHGQPPTHVRRHEDVDVDVAGRAYRRLAARSFLSPGSVRPGVMLSVAMSPGRVSPEWISETVDWMHGGEAWPASALWITTVRLDTGERVVLGRGDAPDASIGSAVAASCAIPGVFAPVRIDGIPYIDGGAWSPTNLDVLAPSDLDVVIVSAPMSAEPGAARDRGDRMTRDGCRAMLESEVALLRGHGLRTVVVQPAREDLAVMGRLLGPEVLDNGRSPGVVAQAATTVAARFRRSAELEDVLPPPTAAQPA
ncbi:MAG: putative esterase of the alpha-beta hydrolase superfamily [Solirubrobacterales bacterium]|nr:putative esterase of the alpha-beta hydrolase superfamily [Solirubrobacterales bacterium]